MKIQLLVCFTLIVSQLLHAQQPKGPGGNDLFKKGNCERAGVNFSVCTYCEDKELTKNCKDYWCTDNGTCTEAPLKKTNNQLVRTNVEGVKYIALGKNDTTSKLPKGTKFVNGKVTIQRGYKVVYSSDKKILAILSDSGPGINGSFRCFCPDGEGTCSIQVLYDKIACSGDDCCELIVNIEGLTMQAVEKAPEKLTWKRVVLPTKSN